jgi:hypothetical protein
MSLWNAVSAFANCGHAVAHVEGSYVRHNRTHTQQQTALFDHFVGRTNSVGGTVGLSALLRSGWERTDRRLSPSSFFAK